MARSSFSLSNAIKAGAAIGFAGLIAGTIAFQAVYRSGRRQGLQLSAECCDLEAREKLYTVIQEGMDKFMERFNCHFYRNSSLAPTTALKQEGKIGSLGTNHFRYAIAAEAKPEASKDDGGDPSAALGYRFTMQVSLFSYHCRDHNYEWRILLDTAYPDFRYIRSCICDMIPAVLVCNHLLSLHITRSLVNIIISYAELPALRDDDDAISSQHHFLFAK